MPSPQTEMLIEMLETCRSETVKLAQKTPENKRLFQIRPGKSHPLWLLGHLANTLDVVGNHWAFGTDRRLPSPFGKKFAPGFMGGDPVTSNPEDYPTWEEVLQGYERAMDGLLSNLRGIDDSLLSEKPRGEVPAQLEEFFSNIGAIARIMIHHDHYHRGQMGMLNGLSEEG